MNLTLRTVVLSVLVTLMFSFAAAAIVKTIDPESNAEPVIADATEYFLRLENNEIVIYKNGESINAGIAVSDLRKQDRILLESGIGAHTYEDVLKLIEDFSS